MPTLITQIGYFSGHYDNDKDIWNAMLKTLAPALKQWNGPNAPQLIAATNPRDTPNDCKRHRGGYGRGLSANYCPINWNCQHLHTGKDFAANLLLRVLPNEFIKYKIYAVPGGIVIIYRIKGRGQRANRIHITTATA